MQGKVSIVVPVFNGEKYIEQTLSNILNATYENLEIIVVNDGSTDKSLQICEKIQKNDSRVVIYTKKNGGIVSARNYGVSQVNGEYLCFCDQDDIVGSDMYSKMVVCMEKSGSDICMCSTGRYIEGKFSAFEMSANANYSGDEILKYLLFPLVFNGYSVPIEMSDVSRYPHIWNCMFRMKFWHQFDFQFRSYVNFEDDLLLKIDALSRAERVSTVSYVGYYWRVNLQSETYAHKFVENIREKQHQCYIDMYNSLSRRVKDTAALDIFIRVTRCNQYLIAIHNLTSPMCKKNINTIKQYYKKMIYDYDFVTNIEARKYLKRGRIKPMILLPLLAKRLTILSYIAERLLDYVLRLSLHSQTLTVFERKLKEEKR